MSDVSVALHLRAGDRRWRVPFASLPFDDSPGRPWLLVPTEVREAFDLVTHCGVPLERAGFGTPLLGVKSGCNEAFLVTVDERVPGPPGFAVIRVGHAEASSHEGLIERAALRPVVRGEAIRPWLIMPSTESIVWTHGDVDAEVNTPVLVLPTQAAAWLGQWRRRLEARSDVQARSPWWSLFRTPSAAWSTTRVVWSDIGRRPRAAVLAAGDRSVPINSCYVVRVESEDDAQALAALLNSELAAAWLNVIAEPAAGGYRRYLAWTVGLLPVPRDWPRARALLAPIGRTAAAGSPPEDRALTAAVADAYALSLDRLGPLLSWTTW